MSKYSMLSSLANVAILTTSPVVLVMHWLESLNQIFTFYKQKSKNNTPMCFR